MVNNREWTLLGIMVRSQGTTPLCREKREVSLYNGRTSGVPIYSETQAISLSDIYIVKLVVAKDYGNASAYQSQFFFHCSPSAFL